MTNKKIKDIEEQIEELKSRWPPHSVPPHMWQRLEELETKLAKAKADASADEQ